MPAAIPASSPSWDQIYRDIATVLPHVAASLVVLLLGILLGIVAGHVAARILRKTSLDRHAANAGMAASLQTIGVASPAGLVAIVLEWFLIVSSTIVALYLLDSRLASGLAERFLLYLPHLGGALLVLGGGVLAARFLSRSVLIAAVNREVGAARLWSDATRVGIMTLTVAVAFEQAQIGHTTILVAFAIVLGGATLAVALAVGLSLRDVVGRWLHQQMDAPRKPDGQDMFQHL